MRSRRAVFAIIVFLDVGGPFARALCTIKHFNVAQTHVACGGVTDVLAVRLLPPASTVRLRDPTRQRFKGRMALIHHDENYLPVLPFWTWCWLRWFWFASETIRGPFVCIERTLTTSTASERRRQYIEEVFVATCCYSRARISGQLLLILRSSHGCAWSTQLIREFNFFPPPSDNGRVAGAP